MNANINKMEKKNRIDLIFEKINEVDKLLSCLIKERERTHTKKKRTKKKKDKKKSFCPFRTKKRGGGT